MISGVVDAHEMVCTVEILDKVCCVHVQVEGNRRTSVLSSWITIGPRVLEVMMCSLQLMRLVSRFKCIDSIRPLILGVSHSVRCPSMFIELASYILHLGRYKT